MAGKMRHLCQWSPKRIAGKLDKLAALVGRPKYICQACARAAGEKQVLCRPIKLVLGEVDAGAKEEVTGER